MDEGPFLHDTVVLGDEVESAIRELLPSDDPLDDPDFDPVKYINTTFPNEQSLTSLDTFMTRLKGKIRHIDSDIQTSVRAQAKAGAQGQLALEDAQRGMKELFQKIHDIRAKAEYSEQMVQEITRDIKSLDYAKKNLTASITTLNHLRMLVGGVESLHVMAKKKQYKDAANLLGAVVNVMEHFKNHANVEKIRDLGKKIDAIKRTLASQIMSEFKTAFSAQTRDAIQLSEACAVVDVLPPETKAELCHWFVDLQLQDYRELFHHTKPDAWVDKVDRRYAWFKRLAASYRENCSEIFPAEWGMPEQLAERFCAITREQLTTLLSQNYDQLDVKLLLFALQKTTQFEQWLAAKFKPKLEDAQQELLAEQEEEEDRQLAEAEASATSEADHVRIKYLRHKIEQDRAARRQGQPMSVKKERVKAPKSKFEQIISKVFESCLPVYIDAQDVYLKDLMEQFVRGFKGETADIPDGEEARVLASCTELFMFFKSCMMQCLQFSSSKALLDLYQVFKTHLKLYAQRMLSAHFPRATALPTILLKEGELKLSPQELYITCCILNTAEYAMDTTNQLEDKLKERIGEEKLAEQIDLNEEMDLFGEVVSTAIHVLVRSMETSTEPSLLAMTKMKWDSIEEVGDTSPYVSQIGRHFAQTMPATRTYLSGSRKYFTNFCLKFVYSFIPKVISYLYKCKNVSSVGAEQLLLDMQSMKMLLLELPSIGSAAAKKPPASYSRFVSKQMLKAEMILKVLRKPHDPPKLYVEDYLELVGHEEGGLGAFQKILDMKGLYKKEQAPLIEEYKSLVPSASTAPASPSRKSGASGGDDVDGSDGVAAPLAALAQSSKRAGILKLEKLMKRFQ
eukprot:m.484296 g.484296  ORF g.484296 m.484296 type:complete len:850 (+) comp23287_c0_seq1:244-2793(+)